MITITNGHRTLPHRPMTFSGGEVQVRLDDVRPTDGPFIIRAHLTDAAAIMELLLVTDALRRLTPGASISLICPYLPYARQDRVCAPGEALSLKVMCGLINDQFYDSVEVWDPHSDVAMALLDRAHAVGQEVFVNRLPLGSNTRLVAPDAGSMRKIGKVAEATGLPFVRADKTRDPVTGQITGTTIYTEAAVGDWDALIVDDICDGGRTFIELAKAVRLATTGRIRLFVTHGIFSQGLGVFEGLIDQVYTANAFPGAGAHPLLTEV